MGKGVLKCNKCKKSYDQKLEKQSLVFAVIEDLQAKF